MAPVNLSRKGEYALLALLDLAMQPPGRPIKIAAIARRQGISQKFLELILSSLKQGGFVESRRGADGGYLLAKDADTTYVGEVLRYLEAGRVRRAQERQKPGSPFSTLWTEVDSAVSSVLDRKSFAEIARKWQERQSAYVPNWEI